MRRGAGRRRAITAGAVVALALATVLGVILAAHPGPLAGEPATVRALQGLPQPVPALAEFVRFTTGSEGALILAAPAIAWLLWRRSPRGLAAVAVVLGSILVVQPVAKEIVDRPRPGAAQVEVRAEHESRSYPSGHSLSTTTVWGAAVGLLWLARRRRLAALACLPVVVTGFASSIQGVHWPSDAIGGTLIGGAAAVVTVRLLAGADGPLADRGRNSPPAPSAV